MFDPVTMKLNVEPLILSALREDITSEDVTTNSVMPYAQDGEADLICKQDGIICGLQVFERVFTLLDEKVQAEFFAADGDAVKMDSGSALSAAISARCYAGSVRR